MPDQDDAIRLPRVAVVVVNWNGLRDTLACLDSLARSDYPALDIVVVDNGSEDGSAAAIRERYPGVRVLEAGENLGFAEGNNRGVALARERGAEVVFLLNNDATVAPDCLSSLARAARELPAGSVLGTKIFYQDQPERIWHFGSLWDRKACRLRPVASDDPGRNWTERLRVDHVIGCAMWIPCDLVRRIGLFDQRFFLNYEETDFCFRAARAGACLYSVPDAHVWHRVGASFRTSAHLTYFLERNRLLWIEKNFRGAGRWQVLLRRQAPDMLGMLLKIVRRSLECAVYALVGARDRLDYKRYKLRAGLAGVLGWVHYCRRRFGDCPPAVKKPFVPSGRLQIDSRGATLPGGSDRKDQRHGTSE